MPIPHKRNTEYLRRFACRVSPVERLGNGPQTDPPPFLPLGTHLMCVIVPLCSSSQGSFSLVYRCPRQHRLPSLRGHRRVLSHCGRGVGVGNEGAVGGRGGRVNNITCRQYYSIRDYFGVTCVGLRCVRECVNLAARRATTLLPPCLPHPPPLPHPCISRHLSIHIVPRVCCCCHAFSPRRRKTKIVRVEPTA